MGIRAEEGGIIGWGRRQSCRCARPEVVSWFDVCGAYVIFVCVSVMNDCE